jgi:hypothetical protein
MQPVQRRLLANSTPSPVAPERQRLVGVAAVAESLGLTESQAQIVMNTLAAVSPGGQSLPFEANGDEQAVDAKEVDMHWLLLFLFVQMYTRPHVQARTLHSQIQAACTATLQTSAISAVIIVLRTCHYPLCRVSLSLLNHEPKVRA